MGIGGHHPVLRIKASTKKKEEEREANRQTKE
jgi:hypothetical protein